MVSRSRLDRYTSVVFVIMGGMLLIHFAIVNIPERQLIFDEYHYVPQARALLSGAQIPIWHPPLGVYLIAFSMAMFGDQEVGWRFFPIVFGVLSIWILYLLACRSTKNRATALLSSTLYALDSLAFVQSSIAMLDIFFVFFMLLGFLLYWRNNRTLACVSMGLSTLCKLVGGAGFIVLVVMMLLDHEKPTLLLKRTAAYALSVALTLWVLLLMQGMQIDPLSALLGMTRGNLFWTPHVTSTFASQPWDWLITPTPIPYYSANIPRRYRVVYRGIGNPMIWLLTVPAVLGLACDYVRHREKSSLFFLLWFIMAYFLPWYPFALLTRRPLFLFYFLPAVGAVTTAISMGFKEISSLLGERLSRIGLSIYLVAALACFIVEFPVKFWE